MLTTTIHAYRFDVSKPKDAKAYGELRDKMKAQGTKCFETWGGQGSHYVPSRDGLVVTLETAFVFDNQWNTAPIPGVSDSGLRVFDWAQDAQHANCQHIKQGHYLAMTPRMIEVRANRMKCGYCGKQYDKRENPPTFCRECLGSQFLKQEDLRLTRVESVLHQTFAQLTQDETAELLPIYQAEQAGKGSARAIAEREAYGNGLNKAFDAKMAELTIGHNGMRWLFDRGCPVRLMKNCIYYSHKDVFTFGWRDKLSAGADLDWLLENLSEFPYEYTIETTHKGTMGGRV